MIQKYQFSLTVKHRVHRHLLADNEHVEPEESSCLRLMSLNTDSELNVGHKLQISQSHGRGTTR